MDNELLPLHEKFGVLFILQSPENPVGKFVELSKFSNILIWLNAKFATKITADNRTFFMVKFDFLIR